MLKFSRSFCILAEELHFGRAAARLHLTQPALTHQIKALEREIGCVLLRRSPQRVELTDAGAALARDLGAALAQVNRAVQSAVDVARGDAGVLAVGYCGLPLAGALTATISRFVARFPRVEVSLSHLPTNEQADALHAGSIDIGYLHPPIDSTGLQLRPAGVQKMHAVLPASHPLAKNARLRLQDLNGERLIFFSEACGPHMHRALVAACANAGFTPRMREEDVSWHTMIDLAAAGLGVAFVPESVQPAAPGVVFRAVADLTLRLETSVATSIQPPRPAVEHFLAISRELVGEVRPGALPLDPAGG
jgi:DNA-binding transcriptional LysR family regulator